MWHRRGAVGQGIAFGNLPWERAGEIVHPNSMYSSVLLVVLHSWDLVRLHSSAALVAEAQSRPCTIGNMKYVVQLRF
jgi:hypothetical protein